MELVRLKELPNFLPVGTDFFFRRIARQKAVEVFDIAKQKLFAVRVMRGVDRLWEIDDHRPVARHQDIKLGQVAVNHTGA